MCNTEYASYALFMSYFSDGCPPIDSPFEHFPLESYGMRTDTGYAIGSEVRLQCPQGTAIFGNGQIRCNFEYNHMTGEIATQWSSELDYDSYCQDTNECDSNPCSYACHNTYSNYQCYCKEDQEPSCDEKIVDIAFIIDISEDILSERFEYFKNFVKKFLEPIKIGDDAARVGIVLSNDQTTELVPMNDENVLESILLKVRAIQCCSGESWLGSSMGYVASNWGKTVGRPLHVIILTDGLAADNLGLFQFHSIYYSEMTGQESVEIPKLVT